MIDMANAIVNLDDQLVSARQKRARRVTEPYCLMPYWILNNV